MLDRILQIGRQLHQGGLTFCQRAAGFFQRSVGKDARLSLGAAGEQAAARFLRRKGYRILARGHRQRLGEIDLIALDGKCIVFVEVKTWRSDDQADPSEAVNHRKQERITRAALIYLKSKRLLEHPARFDVISVVWPDQRTTQPTIRHFPHAFEAVGSGQLYR
jgi:putative endonuclease